MQHDRADLAWQLMVELRKETVATQRVRAQMIGFKITAVGAGIGLILANMDKVPAELLFLPGFAAVFFDLLISSCGFSIKRIGFYCREHLEPILKEAHAWPIEHPLWEGFLDQPGTKQLLSTVGDLGITALSAAPAIANMIGDFSWPALGLTILFLILFAYAVWAMTRPKRVIAQGFGPAGKD